MIMINRSERYKMGTEYVASYGEKKRYIKDEIEHLLPQKKRLKSTDGKQKTKSGKTRCTLCGQQGR
jgi:hypothetical protein